MSLLHRHRHPALLNSQKAPVEPVVLDYINPLTSQMIGCWLLNEPNPRNYAALGSAPCTMSNSPPMAAGPLGAMISTSQPSSQGILTGLQVGAVAQFSIALWLYGNAEGGFMNRVVASGQTDFTHNGFQLRGSGNTQWVLEIGNGTIAAAASGNLTVNANFLYHLVGTYDGANVRLYQNGVLFGGPTALTGNMTMQGTTPIGIAYDPAYNGDYCTALFGPCMAWTRALSAAEVVQLYTQPFCMLVPAAPRVFSSVIAAAGAPPYQPWYQRAPILAQ